MSTQDDALIYQLNQADPSLGGEDYSDDDTEDPVGKATLGHDAHHKRAFDFPRHSEQPRGVIPPLAVSRDLPRSKRIPLQRLTAQTRQRDRAIYRETDLRGNS